VIKLRRHSNPAEPQAPRRMLLVLLVAMTGGLVSGTVMWASAAPLTHAIMGGFATAVLLFLDKIIR